MATVPVKISMKNVTRPARPKLTPAERRCLEAFKELKRRGNPHPSHAELAEHLKLATPYVFRLIMRLIEKGRLTNEPGKTRSLRLAKAS